MGRTFKRDTNERKALFKSLISSLVLKERIQTTEAKAKTIKSLAEKVITKAKKEGEKAERHIGAYINSDALGKLIKDVAPRFKDRPGGYTRIIRLGRRVSDNASIVYLELVEKASAVAVVEPKVSKVDAKVSEVSKGKDEKKATKKSPVKAKPVRKSSTKK